MVYVLYDIMVLLFVCRLHVVWLVLDSSLCRGGLFWTLPCVINCPSHHSSCTLMPKVYSELGRYPLFVDRIVASMKYIHYIENETENKLLKSCYECIKDYIQLGRNCKLTVMEKQLSGFIKTKANWEII